MRLAVLLLTVVATLLIWRRWRNFFNVEKAEAFPLKEALERTMPLGILGSVVLFQVLMLINDAYQVPTTVVFIHSLVPLYVGVGQAARLYRNYKRRVAGKFVCPDGVARGFTGSLSGDAPHSE